MFFPAVAKAKSPNPSAGSATEGDIFPEGPLNTSTDPPNSNQLSPNNPQQSPPAISSQPPSASLSTTAPPLIMKPALKDILLNSAFKNRLSPPSPTISPSSTSVDNKQGRHGNVQGGDQGPNQGESQPRSDGQSVPQGDVPVGANSYTYWSTSRPQGDDNPPQSELFDENGFLAENGMQNGADEEDLDATADMKKDEFESECTCMECMCTSISFLLTCFHPFFLSPPSLPSLPPSLPPSPPPSLPSLSPLPPSLPSLPPSPSPLPPLPPPSPPSLPSPSLPPSLPSLSLPLPDYNSDFTNEVNENPYQEKSDATGQNTFEGEFICIHN